MAELLVELISEEIPAAMQEPAARALAKALEDGLAERHMTLAANAVTPFATPRRIGLVASGIPAAEPTRTVRRRGPRVDAPEQAQEGFRRALAGTRHRVEELEEKKGRFFVAHIEEGGAAAATVVKDILEAFLPRFPWPKSMRWGEGDARWVRPLHRILCLLDGAVVPVTFAGLEAAAATVGHRFMAPAVFGVRDGAEHARKLEAAKVVRAGAERRRRILDGARTLAAQAGLVLREDGALLDELAGLTEWPVPLMGRIDDTFMALPPEVLTTSMRSHQKYLALDRPDGMLAPRFVVVADLEASDGGAAIVAGNERVLRARLWDARFFWDTDRRHRLEERRDALARMVFHARLGSMADKADRLERLAAALARRLGTAAAHDAARAGALAKADLVTGMVGEFPELQGVMGAYYARAQGESDAVAEAIDAHYAPQGPNDRCPTAPVAVVTALADKLDSLAGFHAAGERATGSSDPLGLRRLALGIIRLVFENELRLPLGEAFAEARAGYGDDAALAPMETVAVELVAFVMDRLKVHLRGEDIRADLIAAVFAAGADDDLWRLRRKVAALQTLLESTDGANLLAAYRRARNIVRIESKKDGAPPSGEVRGELLEAPAEIALHHELAMVMPTIRSALAEERFTDAMVSLASLRAPVDKFFEEVLVNVDEPAVRANRLRLLARLSGLLDGVAVFDMIEEPRIAA
jgi:glycyl-tRNA synthetase beta chain